MDEPDVQSLVATAQAQEKRPRGRPRKTVDERDDGNRRRELIHSAAKLFRKKGFDATSTRDIAAAVGMRSGSPFYHFKSKSALLYAVMDEGMRSAIEKQERAVAQFSQLSQFSKQPQRAPKKTSQTHPDARGLLTILIRSHFDVLLGPDSDFIPVMLYEWRSLTARQRTTIAKLQSEYEAPWVPVLQALQSQGALHADVKLARLLIFGALNWSAQWFDRKQGASLDELTSAAMDLFLGKSQ